MTTGTYSWQPSVFDTDDAEEGYAVDPFTGAIVGLTGLVGTVGDWATADQQAAEAEAQARAAEAEARAAEANRQTTLADVVAENPGTTALVVLGLGLFGVTVAVRIASGGR